jgi:hypothetical protein
VSATSIGIFEQTAPGYGEIWYFLGGRKGPHGTNPGALYAKARRFPQFVEGT